MSKKPSALKASALSVALGALLAPPLLAQAQAVCTAVEVATGLERPQGIAQSNLGNLIVGEAGPGTPNTGRISIVAPTGERRTLLSGLPSGRADVGDPSGPAGVFLRGRTLYVAIGIGDSILAGPMPRTVVANPTPSSPIFSSVLAIHFSAAVERNTTGFALSLADQQALALGQRVTLANGSGETLSVEMVANFPDWIPDPVPALATNVRGSNPFDLVLVADQIYATDGGRNLVWKVDAPTGSYAPLASFPNIPNPIFPVGPPTSEAVPTGISFEDGRLLVTLLRGAPFANGTSTVMQVDPTTGAQSALISGLKTAIDTVGLRRGSARSQLVLQHSYGPAPFFGGPGAVLRFESPAGPAQVIDNCLSLPTSMAWDAKAAQLYVTELVSGRLVAIPVSP